MNEILFLTTQFPYPLDNGGKIGAFNGLNVISKKYKVTVLSFVEDDSVIEEGINYFKDVLPNVTFIQPIRHDVHIRKKPVKLARAILAGTVFNIPYAVSKFRNKEMYATIDRIIKDKHWSAVFVDYINMCSYGKYIRENYKHHYDFYIFKDHNKEYEIVEQEAKKYTGIRKRILENDAKRTLMCESDEARNADLVYSVCADNTEFLSKFNSNAHSMLPTYSTQKMEVELAEVNNTTDILYVGGLSWAANLEGLKWFVDEVFPIIQERIPNVTLTIVGGGLDYNPFELHKGIKYLGYVKKLDEVYLDKGVFIVPLFEGSGIRIKILEAFDNMVPVVSTSLGCNTIGAVNNHQLIIADDASGFAKGVITLLSDKEFNMNMRKNAKLFLQDKFSLENRQEEFINEITRLNHKKINR